MRVAVSFSIENIHLFKQKALAWANQFSVCCALDNHNYKNHLYHSHEFLLGASSIMELNPAHGKNFESLAEFYTRHKEWLFGFLTYDLKNEIEKLESENPDRFHFPELHFFIPDVFIELRGNEVFISSHTEKPERIFSGINKTELRTITPSYDLKVEKKISEEEYLKSVRSIKNHILRGDVYELNFCQEFFIKNYPAEPLDLFFRLMEISPSPFSAYYKLNEKYLVCASPERFMKKQGNKIISQPIKGTIKRGVTAEEDEALKLKLFNDTKERSENVMIVDLVRNDLSRNCKAGSVTVEELFGIYSYPHVHQMISTVTGELNKSVHFVDAIRNGFPMGSMTGAPKIEAMKLIEQYEKTKRGLFSGAVGYISPDGDFDFNVVIRSLLYSSEQKYLSFSTGSAITFNSVPEREYEECLLKAKAMMKLISGK